MARRGESESIVEDVYRQLRERILSGDLPPGARLKVNELRTRMNVSVSALREALTRLEQQDLVTLAHNQGFAVKEFDAESIVQLVEVRIELETLALRKSIKFGSIDWETAVTAAHYRLARVPRFVPGTNQVTPEWTNAHNDFHMKLLSACRNPLLMSMCEALFDKSALYRRWSVAAPGERPVEQEHQELYEAAVRRDKNATRLLREHISRTARRVLAAPPRPSADEDAISA